MYFLARCYGGGATSECLSKIKIQRVAPLPPTTVFFSDNYAKWSVVWYKNLDRSFFGFVTMRAFHRQADVRTDGHSHG